MNESIVRFGPGEILAGVLNTPENVRPGSPVVVMWNVGLNHHVGPSRVWVDLARRLARDGIASLRFDMAGLGDSAPREDLAGDIERAILDLEAALTWLAENVSSDFVLVSNCSGTDNSHEVTLRDARVRGAVFLDGYTYVTPRLLFHQHVLCWAEPARYKRALMRRYPRWFGIEPDNRVAGGVDEIYKRQYPSREKFEADLRRMVDRGVKLLFTFSSESMYAYKSQFWDWLDRKDWGSSISLEFYREASHAYSFREEREILLRRVSSWILALPALQATARSEVAATARELSRAEPALSATAPASSSPASTAAAESGTRTSTSSDSQVA